MVMTRPSADGATGPGGDAGGRRTVARAPGVPGGRAVVGGLLVAVAGVATFVGWQRASGPPATEYAVAVHALRPGDAIGAGDVRFAAIDLPAGVADAAVGDAADLEGRVVVGPVAEGELVQLGALSDRAVAGAAAEVSVGLARDRAVDGRVAPGDTVDVYATHDATSVVATGVQVIAVTEAGGSFADGSDLTVTLALTDPDQRVPVIHAAREGQVTLVRTTHAGAGGG